VLNLCPISAIQCNWDEDQYDPLLSSIGLRTLSTSRRSQRTAILSPTPPLGHPQRSTCKRAIHAIPDFRTLRDNIKWHNSLERRLPAADCYERSTYCEPNLTDDDQSSEDELSIINSSIDDHSSPSFRDDMTPSNADLRSSTSAYEPKPLKFISSPPKGVHKLRHILSPALFLARLSSNKVGLYSFGHRKRLKQMESRDVSDALRIERPCLDFEKMRVEFCL